MIPVDSFGVGKCPEPSCCAEAMDRGIIDDFSCHTGKLPSIKFREMDNVLNRDARILLDSITMAMYRNPICSLIINGYYNLNNKKLKFKNERRAKVIYDYFISKGVAPERLSINIQPGGAINRFDFIPYR